MVRTEEELVAQLIRKKKRVGKSFVHWYHNSKNKKRPVEFKENKSWIQSG